MQRATRFCGRDALATGALVTVLVIATALPAAAADPPPDTPSTATAIEAQMAAQIVGFVNQERMARGLAPVTADASLMAGEQQITNAQVAGTLADGDQDTPATLPYGSGGSAWAGPGVGASGSAVAAWMGSSGHRDVLLMPGVGDVIGVGVGCSSSGADIASLFVANTAVGLDPVATTPDVPPGIVSSEEGSSCTTPMPPSPVTATMGYHEVAADGGIFTFGTAGFFGSTGGLTLGAPVVGMAVTPDGRGYWEVAADGGIFTYGDAAFYGSLGGRPLNSPVVGMAATPDGGGYWLVAADGGVFAFGDAGFFGSAGGLALSRPVVGIAATPDGGGYWLVASDGGIFTYGDAAFAGSMGGQRLDAPVVGIAATSPGGGYEEVASDGGVFAFGGASYFGSMGGRALAAPVVGIEVSPDGAGYWEVAADGGIFAYGDAQFAGSMGGVVLNRPVVGMA